MRKRKSRGSNDNHKLQAGEQVFLTENLPCGLFASTNGNRYIITSEFDLEERREVKIAVALDHCELPPFTLQLLDQRPLDNVHWLGRYRIRLLNGLNEECGMGRPGIISMGDRHVSIHARQVCGSNSIVSLGFVGCRGFEFRDFDGWAIEPKGERQSFFETAREDRVNLVIEPKLEYDIFGASLSNSIKQMLKEGTMDKKLVGGRRGKFAYQLSAKGMLLAKNNPE